MNRSKPPLRIFLQPLVATSNIEMIRYSGRGSVGCGPELTKPCTLHSLAKRRSWQHTPRNRVSSRSIVPSAASPRRDQLFLLPLPPHRHPNPWPGSHRTMRGTIRPGQTTPTLGWGQLSEHWAEPDAPFLCVLPALPRRPPTLAGSAVSRWVGDCRGSPAACDHGSRVRAWR